jgi:DNA-binding NarL/FixJ family response regulator
MPAPRVLLADDHHLLLGALEKLLQEDCQIVGRVSDGHALVAAAQQLKPDVIVLDVAMPLLNGLEAGRQIKQVLRSVKLIYVTMNEDPDIAAEAFRAGASAYLLKRSTPVELLTAIREVMLGRSYVTPLVTEQLVESLLKVEEHKAGQELTSRQREILQLVAEGRSMKEIASVLDITPRTVAHHKYRLMDQLHIKSTAELVQYAVKHNMV